MQNNIFSGLITSKMRVRLLMRLFLNAGSQAYLRELATEFDASPGQLGKELQSLSQSGLVVSEKKGRQIHYQANQEHPLFPELQSMVRKALGMDRIIESILRRLGNLELAFLMDDYAEGKDRGIIDLGLVGDIDLKNLNDLVAKSERYLDRKIRTLVLTKAEYKKMESKLTECPYLVLWEKTAVQKTDVGRLENG